MSVRILTVCRAGRAAAVVPSPTSHNFPDRQGPWLWQFDSDAEACPRWLGNVPALSFFPGDERRWASDGWERAGWCQCGSATVTRPAGGKSFGTRDLTGINVSWLEQKDNCRLWLQVWLGRNFLCVKMMSLLFWQDYDN